MDRLLTVIFGLVLLASASAQATQYQLVDLGTLGGSGGFAQAVNSTGQVVGDCQTPSGSYHAFLWQNGIMTDLGTLAGAHASHGAGINDNGEVVGDSGPVAGGYSHAFRWKNGSTSDLGTLAGGNSEAWAINNQSQVVGWSHGPSGNGESFIWQSGTMSNLQVNPGGRGSGAADINDQGQVVGSWYGPPIVPGYYNTHAFLWQAGTRTDLGSLAGCNTSSASGLNNSGEIVGESHAAGSNTNHAFVWKNGIMTELGLGIAHAINDRGQIVGQDNYGCACVWRDGACSQLPSLGGNQSEATAININGLIVGYSYDTTGVQHAILWQPVPEPSSILALLSGIVGLLPTIRKRRLVQR